MIELNADQQEAALRDTPRLEILGGPGCGKTRVIAARIAHMISSGRFKPSQIAALTYTRGMAADLRRRIIEALPEGIQCASCRGTGKIDGFSCGACFGSGAEGFAPPRIGTLHAMAAGWCRDALRGRIAGGAELLALGWITGPDFGIAMPEDVEAVVAAVYAAFRKKVLKRDLVNGLKLSGLDLAGWPQRVAARQELRLRNLVRYDDLLTMLQVVAGATGPGPHLRDEVKCLLVDEAHDLTPAHIRVIESWGPASMTTVGDDAQRIFGFLRRREGEADDNGFMERMDAAGSDLVRLGQNYRTQAPIALACAKVREALVADGACSSLTAIPMRPGAGGAALVMPSETPLTTLVDVLWGLLTGEDDPNRWWGDAPHRAYAPNEIAVLARSWAELDEAQAALAAAGIEASTPSDERKWWSTPAGRIALAIARTAHRGEVDAYDGQTILEALGHQSPEDLVRRLTMVAIERQMLLAEVLNDDSVARAGLPAGWWSSLVKARSIRDLEALLLGVKPHSGQDVLKAIKIADDQDHLETGFVAEQTIEDLLVWLAGDDASTSQIPRGHVILTTFHGAKGLEWPAVVILGACEGGIPAPWDKTEEELLESGRALYVGMTRARDDLYLIPPTNLRGSPRNPSPWLVAAGIATRNPAAAEGRQAE